MAHYRLDRHDQTGQDGRPLDDADKVYDVTYCPEVPGRRNVLLAVDLTHADAMALIARHSDDWAR